MKTPKPDGGPAFPQMTSDTQLRDVGDPKRFIEAPVLTLEATGGMSLHQWYAGMALMGMCANADISAAMSEQGMVPHEVRHSLALSALAQADEIIAMIAERNK